MDNNSDATSTTTTARDKVATTAELAERFFSEQLDHLITLKTGLLGG